MRLYIDSNVFISLIREEVSTKRSLFAEAKSFFEKVAIQEDIVIISELNIFEVNKKCFIKKEELLSILNQLSIKYELSKDITKDSRNIALLGVHYPDCIHASTAINTKCTCIITFNKKDFEVISSTIPILEPNNY